MTKEGLFDIWAPRPSAWSAWVKPVLFAHMTPRTLAAYGYEPPRDHPAAPDVSWAPRADGSAVIVVDLPGAAGVAVGMALAEIGYRPVPLYNACPGPDAREPTDLLDVALGWSETPGAEAVLGTAADGAAISTEQRMPLPSSAEPLPLVYETHAQYAPHAPLRIAANPVSLVDVAPIRAALVLHAAQLAALSLAPGAPPVFLLDADRRIGRGPLTPGRFDNRSVSLPTDFPSGNLLLSKGFRRAIVVQRSGGPPQEDLAHTLKRWQDAGIRIGVKGWDVPGGSIPVEVRRPSLFRALWHRLIVTAGLRRNPLGGFGGTLPEPSSSGGAGG